MPLHYALGKDDPAAIIAAMAAAEGWLAQYDGSKVFMSANTEVICRVALHAGSMRLHQPDDLSWLSLLPLSVDHFA